MKNSQDGLKRRTGDDRRESMDLKTDQQEKRWRKTYLKREWQNVPKFNETISKQIHNLIHTTHFKQDEL